MNNKIIGLLLIIIAGCTMLTGCGTSGNTRKLKSMAVKYVKEKYGFKAKANRVSNDGRGKLSVFMRIWTAAWTAVQITIRKMNSAKRLPLLFRICKVPIRKSLSATRRGTISI